MEVEEERTNTFAFFYLKKKEKKNRWKEAI